MSAGSVSLPLRRAGAAGAGRVREGLARAGGAVTTAHGRLTGGQKLVITLSVLLVLAVSWLVLRNSSLVAVEKVQVVGLSGYYDRNARRALTTEALTMTTMNVDEGRLADVVSQFVDVAAVRVDTDFPHGLTVQVVVRRPVAVAKFGSTLVGVTGTGLLLDNSQTLAGLPKIEVNGPVTHGHLTDRKALEAVTVLGAAPDVMLRQVRSVKWGTRGLAVVLAKGVKLYFGGKSQAAAKWQAIVTILSGSSARGAHYIDVRIPDRPAVGGLGPAPVTPRPQPLATPVTKPPVTEATGTGATTATGDPATQITAPTAATTAPAQEQQQTAPAGTGAPAGGSPAGNR